MSVTKKSLQEKVDVLFDELSRMDGAGLVVEPPKSISHAQEIKKLKYLLKYQVLKYQAVVRIIHSQK